MFIVDKEISFLIWYVAEKEFDYTDKVREALNLIHYLISKKNVDKALAIDIVSKKYNKQDLDFNKDFLYKVYNRRLAFIKSGKEAYKRMSYLKRVSKDPNFKIEYCACGCGSPVKKGNKFVHGHHVRIRSKNKKNEIAKKMRDAKAEKRIVKKSNNVIKL